MPSVQRDSEDERMPADFITQKTVFNITLPLPEPLESPAPLCHHLAYEYGCVMEEKLNLSYGFSVYLLRPSLN